MTTRDPAQRLFTSLLLGAPPALTALILLTVSLVPALLLGWQLKEYLAYPDRPPQVRIDDVPSAAKLRPAWIRITGATWYCDQKYKGVDYDWVPIANSRRDVLVIYLPAERIRDCDSPQKTPSGVLTPINDSELGLIASTMPIVRSVSRGNIYMLVEAQGPSDSLAMIVVFGIMLACFLTASIFFLRQHLLQRRALFAKQGQIN